jgi:hypothetical protein
MIHSEGTLCYGGDFNPHKEWRGLKLPIKVIPPPRNINKLPHPDSFDGYQLFVMPGGQAVYFPNGVTPVYVDDQSVAPVRVFATSKNLKWR